MTIAIHYTHYYKYRKYINVISVLFKTLYFNVEILAMPVCQNAKNN